ncbi:Uu.00g087390.m01.CDS01 [Anthostomella pinea]|uniref:Arylsulfatase n=1 Tax=Anthostomella pinea TaxID=933095 RepID=A0AAI8VGX3_9PEZI|nr:Uu.00g087390.m01.CDS01 [Anthostomella pinea]
MASSWPSCWLLALSAALWGTTWAADGGQQQQPLTIGKRPNIVFIMSDDQDLHMDSLSYMPHLKKHLTDRGTTFSRHYCTNALCCPSRVSLWTGRAAHNTNVTDVNPPYGGYPKFISQGFNAAYLPLWLQEAGYNTYYIGKLFNAQRVDNYDSPHAAGWTGSDFLLDPHTYEYLNATFQRNHDPPISYEGQYSTDVVADKSYGFLDDALADRDSKPFFLGIAPVAPHCNVRHHEKVNGNWTENSATMSPPVPAKRHEHLFNDIIVPRTEHFNPDEPNSVSWISHLPKQNQTNIDFNDGFYRNRLRSLQPLDEMIEGVISRLEDAGVLDQTYIFYTTDNGYHIGQHRFQPGKQSAFEEDINIPLIVRGPGIAEGMVTDVVTTHTDLAPTLLKLAGAELRSDFDGAAIPLASSDILEAGMVRPEHINVEMWGIIMSEGKYGTVVYQNHTYKALRIIGEHYSFLYTVWCNNEHELYDLMMDPYEMKNLYAHEHSSAFEFRPASRHGGEHTDEDLTEEIFPSTSGSTAHTTNNNTTAAPSTLKHIISRLDSLLMVLKTCKGRECTHPWEVLHPEGNVRDLHDALDEEYDHFYETQQRRVHFTKCEKGYIIESEGEVGAKAWPVDEAGVRVGAAWNHPVERQ